MNARTLLPLLTLLFLTPTAFSQSFDTYGGYTALKGTSTGRWHFQEIGDRHWLITPEGNAFYLLGINHVYVQGDSLQQIAQQNLQKWNFNSPGYGAPDWIQDQMPHLLQVTLHESAHWKPAHRFGYTDVFAPSYQQAVEKIIKKQCAIGKKNPYVIGYSLTDTPRYDLDIARQTRGTDWVSHHRRLPAAAPGKQAYVNWLREHYNSDWQTFQRTYRLENLLSFEDLLDYDFSYLELTRSGIRRDDELFLLEIVERIYGLAKQYFDRYDPEALVLGEKFKTNDHPEGVLLLAGQYFDAISIQPGPTQGPDVGNGPDESQFDAGYYSHLHQLTSKPILIADHGFSFSTPQHPRTLWNQFPSESAAASFYRDYLSEVKQLPFIFGYLKCQYQDVYDPVRDLLKQGIVRADGRTPYAFLARMIALTNADLFKQVYGLE